MDVKREKEKVRLRGRHAFSLDKFFVPSFILLPRRFFSSGFSPLRLYYFFVFFIIQGVTSREEGVTPGGKGKDGGEGGGGGMLFLAAVDKEVTGKRISY